MQNKTFLQSTPTTDPHPMYSWTLLQILYAIANWEHAPFTKKELTFLIKFFFHPEHKPENCSYSYGENNIDSFILETLSEMDN